MPLTDFTLDSKNEITSCPEGCAPKKTRSKDDNHTTLFSKKTCRSCFRKNTCPTLPGKKGRYLRYNDKAIRLAQRRIRKDTSEFRDKYRFRSGIEATMSQLDRLTSIKNLRVRGLSRVSFAAFLKAAGVYIMRTVAYWNRETEGTLASAPAVSSLYCAVKERLLLVSFAIKRWSRLWRPDMRLAFPYVA